MTHIKTLLVGKWEFIKAEKFNGTEWEPAPHTNDLKWEFHPEYVNATKTIGAIVETAPLVEPMRLNYIFNDSDNLLRIEVYTDPETRINDEIDIYLLSTAIPESTVSAIVPSSTITLSLINQLGCPPPYLRYTLRQI